MLDFWFYPSHAAAVRSVRSSHVAVVVPSVRSTPRWFVPSDPSHAAVVRPVRPTQSFVRSVRPSHAAVVRPVRPSHKEFPSRQTNSADVIKMSISIKKTTFAKYKYTILHRSHFTYTKITTLANCEDLSLTKCQSFLLKTLTTCEDFL